MSKCSYPKCAQEVGAAHLCCVSHWNKLPPRIRAGCQERIRGWKSLAAAQDFLNSYFSQQRKVQQ
jgi:hypothetical protein